MRAIHEKAPEVRREEEHERRGGEDRGTCNLTWKVWMETKHSLPVATFAPSQWAGGPQRLRFAPESQVGVFVSKK